MLIFVNGETNKVQQSITLQELISSLNYEKNTFAVALNEEFVPRANYNTTILQEHDRVDIVSAMQGG